MNICALRKSNIIFIDSYKNGDFVPSRLLVRFFGGVNVCLSLNEAKQLLDKMEIDLVIENLPVAIHCYNDVVSRIRHTIPDRIPVLIISATKIGCDTNIFDNIKILEAPIRVDDLLSYAYELIVG